MKVNSLLALLVAVSLTRASFLEKKLTKRLLDHYGHIGRAGRPVSNARLPLIVHFGLTLQQVVDVSVETQSISSIVWYSMSWRDELLRWNITEAVDIEDVRLPTERIFIPDILPYNVAAPVVPLGKVDVSVTHDGTCTWIPPVKLQTSCRLADIDSSDQTCTIKMGSWTYEGRAIDLRLESDQVDLSTLLENPRWEVVSTSAKRNVLTYACCPEYYIDLTFTVTLRKK